MKMHMKRNMAVMILAAVSAWAAPKQAGYPC
jgi:hypothetical protein